MNKLLPRTARTLLKVCNYNSHASGKPYSTSLSTDPETNVFPEEFVQAIIQAHPSLYVHKTSVWNGVYGTLLKQGFSLDGIKKMLLKVPRILELQHSDINAVVKVFRNYNLGDKKTIEMISMEPRLLLLDPEAMQTRLGTMFSVFPKKDIVRLLKEGECVHAMFFETWDSIYEKLYFIDQEMGYDQSHMIRANALKYSLEYIKLRYNFLLRCGKYKRPNPKVFDNKELKLRVMLNSNNYDLPALTGVSQEEYEVFIDLFEEECKNSNSELESDDDIS